MSAPAPTAAPEHNVTGADYSDRRHFRYAGPPLIDIHAHVTLVRPQAGGAGIQAEPSLEGAEIMLAEAREFGIGRTYSMCPPEDIPPLRQRFGPLLGFN